MLTDTEITMAEAIYLAIDSNKLSPELCQCLVDGVYITNKEAHAYLIWLLKRWRYALRKHRYHLPTRIKQPPLMLYQML